MGARGELFTTQVMLENRSYFFNVKENRTGDVFLQVVESKSKNGEDFDRHAIVVFADDMQKFFKGLDESLTFIEKDRKERSKAAAERKAAKSAAGGKRIYKKPADDQERKSDGIKRTGKVHVVSKRQKSKEE
ncbi:DUF3276 family protein [Treponema brennaborense]|uniref:PUR-alpha/beta/gamma DNA/RNA-binding protein n=1 Tax=Treponema brennaborense (strain DSM 12168 / CIP 105900 / DD5/3) TaxID=906968 RepID=F4LPN8_TREBD|nr:DUF3276 family protein [Treponema brennaborense]AEE17034.1 PUR-alpha/beta/gamma DNA/RNA-binding protein [Treponema brennaborense DSM 12168]